MEDPQLITTLVPPTWLAWLHDWAPYALAVLLLSTALVRLLLPLARRIEVWAITTPAAWDDSAAHGLVRALEWLARVSGVLLALIPRLTVGRPPEPDAAKRRGPPPLPVLALALVAVLVTGCSSGPQVPIQGQPITIQVEAEACGLHAAAGMAGTDERADGDGNFLSDHEGPRAVGTCSVSVWIDSPVGGAEQTTRGVEAEGEVDSEIGLEIPTS